MVERGKCALKGFEGGAVGGLRQRLAAGLHTVGMRLLPDLAAPGVIGQPIDVLDKPPGIQLFDRLDNLGVQRPAALARSEP